ncbi:TPA: hypothetical protein JBG74_02755 [Legionella pneumophila]|uniref:Uncharacterized protein n=1 Tax=Legionella pneumophila TaxID=446 RepID=A0AAN5PJ83_LEGPN|nr:hypothetical protein [Legionella pneumophila]AEW50441.1 hypothetical protein lp12_0154 [Legionella pneumophila subsp. pneumophila ATCC 43290]AGH55172.1 hypothetical protein LPE509_03081 [Legionella pneumophila subsp. pneumophila LPE509]AGN13082.1 hypothetical protein LP6_0158 [Legionella pneumophila subsp. pneumophila str. Thunder Bay]AOU03310.1 hypothetical protein A9E97_00780 [Legionella pneumophila]AOU06266.1 hypothetical protein A9E98_00780 [Legionella pneumophila]
MKPMKNSKEQEHIAPEAQDPRLSYTEDGRRPLTSTTSAKHPNSLFAKLEERSARESYDQFGNNVTMHWTKDPWN